MEGMVSFTPHLHYRQRKMAVPIEEVWGQSHSGELKERELSALRIVHFIA
jgi:hypothetical protein